MILIITPYNRKLFIVTGYRNLLGRLKRQNVGKELLSIVKKDPPLKGEDACVYEDSRGRYLLWLPSRRVGYGTLAHESHHIITRLFKYIGESAAPETRAYFMEWLPKEIKKRL